MAKELLFSVTRKDCKWNYYRGSGAGGQHRNKTDSAVRCTHIESGAVGRAEDTRSQGQNKVLAFKRMANSPEFRKWHRIETARRLGTLVDVNERVEQAMAEKHVRVEFKDDRGRWVAEEERRNAID